MHRYVPQQGLRWSGVRGGLQFGCWLGLWLMVAIAGCRPATGEPPVPTLVPMDAAPTSAATPVESAEARRLDFWQPVSGTLDAAQPQARYVFTAASGDDVTLRAIGQGITLQLTLFDGAGAPLARSNPLQTVIPAAGDYAVVVERLDATSTASSGTYQLGLSYTGQANPSDVAPTALPVIVGVPTPLPVGADAGTFIGELGDGETRAGELTVTDNRHLYTFNARAGEYLRLELTHVSGDVDPLLTLYDPAGAVVAVDADSGPNNGALIRNVRLNEASFYTIQVAGRGQAGVYALRADSFAVAQPVTPTVVFAPTTTPALPVLTPTILPAVPDERLSNHVPVQGVLDAPGALNRHSLLAGAGEIITLGVLPLIDSALIPNVELYDPEGVPVAAASGNTSPANRLALISMFVTTLPGPYTAFITGVGETSGAYLISYGIGTTYRDLMRGEAFHDRPNEATLDQPGTREVWYATLREGDLIGAIVTTGGAFNPILELVSANGDLLGIDSSAPGTAIVNGVRIPRSGVYTFRVSAAQPETGGAYNLLWRYVNVAPTPTPPPGTFPVLSIMDQVTDGQYQFYPLYASAGQRLRISVIAASFSTFDPVVALLDAQGLVIAEGDDFDGGLNPVVLVQIPADGTYTVRVNGYLQGGDYQVLVEELLTLE